MVRVVLRRAPLALLVGAVVVALSAPAARGAETPPPLFLTFRANGTLGVSLGDGTVLGAGSTIAPGPYWVTFTNDFPAERDTVHKWHIFGPGIDIWTDLNCSDSTIEQYLETLRPSSAYTVQDDYHPALQVAFRTAATGSSLAGSSGGVTGAGKGGSTVKNTDVIGSELLTYRGELAATVDASGKLSLTRRGRPVTAVSLKAGRYTINVVDKSRRAGFTLKPTTRGPLPLTSTAFVGRKARRLDLTAGRWMFFSGAAPPTHFVIAPS